MARPMDRVNYAAEQAGAPTPQGDALQAIIRSLYMGYNPEAGGQGSLAEKYLKGMAAMGRSVPRAEIFASGDAQSMENNPVARPALERYRMENRYGGIDSNALPSPSSIPTAAYPALGGNGYMVSGLPAELGLADISAAPDPRKQALMAAIAQSLFGPGTNTAQRGR